MMNIGYVDGMLSIYYGKQHQMMCLGMCAAKDGFIFGDSLFCHLLFPADAMSVPS